MRILFDQGTPVLLRQTLTAHKVSTAFEMGWAKLENGDLLRAAEGQFDVFITTDQNLRYQQNLAGGNWRFWCCRLPTGWNSVNICRR